MFSDRQYRPEGVPMNILIGLLLVFVGTYSLVLGSFYVAKWTMLTTALPTPYHFMGGIFVIGAVIFLGFIVADKLRP